MIFPVSFPELHNDWRFLIVFDFDWLFCVFSVVGVLARDRQRVTLHPLAQGRIGIDVAVLRTYLVCIVYGSSADCIMGLAACYAPAA